MTDITDRSRAEEAMGSSEDEAQGLAQENAVLAEIGRIVCSSLDLNKVYESIAQQVHNVIPFDRISISTADLDAGAFVHEYVAGIEVPGWRTGDVIPISAVGGTAIKTKKPQFIGLGQSLEWQLAYEAGLRSGISVPIVFNDEAIGGLNLRSTNQDAYSQRDLLLAEQIATQIANAIANARLHRQVQRSEEQYRLLVERMNDGLGVQDEHGLITYVNDRLCEMLGYSRDEIIGHPVTEFLDEKNRLVFAESMDGRRKGESRSYEMEYTSKGGQQIASIISAQEIVDKNGNFKGAFAVITDITERKAAEETLRKSEEESRRLAQENAVLAEISRIIASSLDVNEVYPSFAEQVRGIMPFDRMTICAIDMDRGTFSDLYHVGLDVPERRVGAEIPLAGSVTGEVCRLRAGLMIQGETEEQFAEEYPGTIPDFQAGLRSGLSVPLISKNEVTGVLHFRSSESNAFSDDHLALAERIAVQIAGAIANAQLHFELDREAREREVLAEISRVIDSSLDINEVYEPFAEQVRKLIPFDKLSICITDLEQGFNIASYTTGMEVEEREAGVSVLMEGTFAQETVLSRSGVLLQGVSRKHLEDHLPGILPNFDEGLRSFIGVPLIRHDDVIGVLQIRSKGANAYTDTHLALAERIGVQISGAIANSRLYAELSRTEEAMRKNEQRIRELATATVRAHEEERQWAAIEVHDSISQPLVGLLHNIQTLECLASCDPKMRSSANRAFELVQQAFGASRNLMNYLYPPGLEEFGIIPLLETDLHRFHEDTGSKVTFEADSDVIMPQVLTVTLYRIFQEALTNIRRHATGAKMVTVSLRRTDRNISLEVKDDGAGFDVKASKPEGQVGGLMIMTRRAEIIGGTLDMSSTKGKGTTVTVRVPVDGGNI